MAPLNLDWARSLSFTSFWSFLFFARSRSFLRRASLLRSFSICLSTAGSMFAYPGASRPLQSTSGAGLGEVRPGSPRVTETDRRAARLALEPEFLALLRLLSDGSPLSAFLAALRFLFVVSEVWWRTLPLLDLRTSPYRAANCSSSSRKSSSVVQDSRRL